MTQEELLEKARYLLVETGASAPFTINLKEHRIINYPAYAGGFYMYDKIVDTGKYTLLNNNFEVISEYEGYVPNILPNDWGDYLDLNVNNLGYITNMPEKYDFKEFVK